ncbi:hypothetical protein WA026_009740 [Henosepilachna vigintioctopunctata]|uniref:Uncharacterized protein n=1 Tax=Henosepilachna vigintioctopunctata TaxID=420089 RepID=A0AAW1TUF4_9CUCU
MIRRAHGISVHGKIIGWSYSKKHTIRIKCSNPPLLLASFCVLSYSLPLNLAEDENGEHYLMVPLSRNRRESDFSYDISKGPRGTRVELGQQGTVFQKDSIQLTQGLLLGKRSTLILQLLSVQMLVTHMNVLVME